MWRCTTYHHRRVWGGTKEVWLLNNTSWPKICLFGFHWLTLWEWGQWKSSNVYEKLKNSCTCGYTWFLVPLHLKRAYIGWSNDIGASVSMYKSSKNSYMYPKCHLGKIIYPLLLQGRIGVDRRSCSTTVCEHLCTILCCFLYCFLLMIMLGWYTEALDINSGLVAWSLYVFGKERWQLLQWTYCLTSYMSKKEVCNCFGGSAQISGNWSLGLVYSVRMSHHFLPWQSRLAGRPVSWFPCNVIDVTWLFCLLLSSMNMGITWQQFHMTPCRFTWTSPLLQKQDQVYLVCHSLIHIWVLVPSEMSYLGNI